VVQRIHVVGLLQLKRLITRDAKIGLALSRRWRLGEPVRDERVKRLRSGGTDAYQQ
jgi:hypothetical protein